MESTTVNQSTVDQQRSITNLGLRRQVASVTSTSDITVDMTDAMLLIAARLAPHSKRQRGLQGWCTDPDARGEVNAARQLRGKARMSLCADPKNSILRQAIKNSWHNLDSWYNLEIKSDVLLGLVGPYFAV